MQHVFMKSACYLHRLPADQDMAAHVFCSFQMQDGGQFFGVHGIMQFTLKAFVSLISPEHSTCRCLCYIHRGECACISSLSSALDQTVLIGVKAGDAYMLPPCFPLTTEFTEQFCKLLYIIVFAGMFLSAPVFSFNLFSPKQSTFIGSVSC